jgi:hypothetical protein
MDLRTAHPHSPREKPAGYAHFVRTIDKRRAVLAERRAIPSPCSMDKRLLDFASLTAEQFTKTVRARASDHAVMAWFVEHAGPH